MLKDAQDAYGHLILDYYNGQEIVEVVERDDGFIGTSRLGPSTYLAEFDDWAEHQKVAMTHVTGRVLDIGCGAGRHAIYLQEQGFDVIGADNSPLAIQVCQRRGLKNAVVAPITQLNSKIGTFDTLLMMGHNFGLVGNVTRARWLLKRFHKMTTPAAKILAETQDIYQTTAPCHLAYHQFNRDRGRMGGQLRIRVRYRQFATPWFDILFVSKPEMEQILLGTGWTVERYIDATDSTPTYIAILKKTEDR